MRFLKPYRQYRPHIRSPIYSYLVNKGIIKPQKAAWVNTRTPVQFSMVILIWICIILALAKPQWVDEPYALEKPSRDLMVLVDISGSMDSADTAGITRLHSVKSVLHDFALTREGDRLGLIVFADRPYIQAPLSADITVWQTLLQRTETGPAGRNTAIGDALGLGLQHLQHSDIEEKVILLLTDGTDNRSLVPPIEAANIARIHGIKIFAVAIGDDTSQSDAPIDTTTLQRVADISGGKFYRAQDKQALLNMSHDFEQEVPAETKKYWVYPRRDLHIYPMMVSASIVLLALVIAWFRQVKNDA
jgi:Ca-activated chloride channel family protein